MARNSSDHRAIRSPVGSRPKDDSEHHRLPLRQSLQRPGAGTQQERNGTFDAAIGRVHSRQARRMTVASVDRVAGYAVLTSLVLVCCWAWAQPVDEPCPDGYVRDPHAKCVPRSPDTAPSGTPDAGPPAIRFPPGFDLAQLPEGCRIKATASPYNGDLLLQGCDFVYFENGARLVVADANSVQISAGRGIVIGGAATIVTRGRPGASGSPGPAYPGEPWQSRGDADYWAARNQCARRSEPP